MKIYNTTIVRVEDGIEGVFGVLCIEGKAFCVTLEPHDSKIPCGTYNATIHQSYRFKRELWMLNDVPERSYILIHSGNAPTDSEGCILIGQFFDKLRGNRAILNSGATLNKFMQITRNSTELSVCIKEV